MEILVVGDVDISYLWKVVVVVKFKEGVMSVIIEVYDVKGFVVIIGNIEVFGFFGVDLNWVFVILFVVVDLLDFDDVLKVNENKFFILYVLSDFDDLVVLNKIFNFDGVVLYEFVFLEGVK